MRISYDSQADAAYIRFKDVATQVTTIRLSEDVAVDLGPGEEVVGIEILSASEHLSLNPQNPRIQLENLQAA